MNFIQSGIKKTVKKIKEVIYIISELRRISYNPNYGFWAKTLFCLVFWCSVFEVNSESIYFGANFFEEIDNFTTRDNNEFFPDVIVWIIGIFLFYFPILITTTLFILITYFYINESRLSMAEKRKYVGSFTLNVIYRPHNMFFIEMKTIRSGYKLKEFSHSTWDDFLYKIVFDTNWPFRKDEFHYSLLENIENEKYDLDLIYAKMGKNRFFCLEQSNKIPRKPSLNAFSNQNLFINTRFKKYVFLTEYEFYYCFKPAPVFINESEE